MAGKTGGSSPDMSKQEMESIKRKILDQAHSFSFFQIFRVLRVISREKPEKRNLFQDFFSRIDIKPKLSLAFPASDVESVKEIERDDEKRFLIIANLLGLYGSSSPLPMFYTEDLIEEENEDESVSRDFIDIINQRIFELLFECWLKYRQFLQVFEADNPSYMDKLFCLIGMGEPSLRKGIENPHGLLRYAGLFTQQPHSAVGLKTILKDSFPGIKFDIRSCVEKTTEIPDDQLMRIGVSSYSLGVDTYIGREILDKMGKFRIQIGPMSIEEFKGFYPGSKNYNQLTFLTGLYFIEPLEYDLELILKEGEAQTVCLGDPSRATLGFDTFIFSSSEIMGEIKTILQTTKN
ncbi:MAG: type VI secretion system baseplate subunit TssG [Desulfobacteraceae bacterium]|jgi:type VI secretion system protein ImpH